MIDFLRKIATTTFAVIAGLSTLPPLIFGAYLVWCSFRIHTQNVYYVEYPYLVAACVFIGIGLLSLFCVIYALRRRSFYGALFVIPLVLGLAALVYIPDGTPHAQRSSMDDVNLMSDVQAFFGVWYGSHQAFPKDEAEFREAVKEGPAAWQFRVGPIPESDYAKNGKRLPYEIIVISGATGPKLDGLSNRPGVVYYCVSTDYQQFWATVTALRADVAPRAVLMGVGDRSYDSALVIRASGQDYAPPLK